MFKIIVEMVCFTPLKWERFKFNIFILGTVISSEINGEEILFIII